jgi:phosphate-selective porin
MLWFLAALAAFQVPPGEDRPADHPHEKTEELPVDATFKDYLRFKTRNGEYEGYLDGFLRIHARTIFGRPDDDTAPLRSLPDTVLIRQARLDHGASFLRDWGYRVTIDFATGTANQSTGAAASNGHVSLQDAWIEWRHFRELKVRLGQFYEPVSAEEISGVRYAEFAERSPMNRISPGRDLGLEVYGSLFGDGLTYYLMAANGGSLLQDQGRSVSDSNDEKEIAGLVYARPVPFLRLGAGGSFGDADTIDAASFDLITTELSLLYLDSTAGTFDGRRWRGDASILAFGGPASLRLETLGRGDRLAPGMGRGEVRSLGWYAAATWYLTGEEKRPDTPPTPIHDWGTIELGARVGRLAVRNAFESGIALPGGNAEAVTAYTFAVSWWYTRFLRVTVDLDREVFSDRLDFDPRRARALTGLLARIQLDF